MSDASQAARPQEVQGVGLDPDADSLNAVIEHARRRLRRLGEDERATVLRLVDLQRQIGRERAVLMLNGLDPEALDTKKEAPAAVDAATGAETGAMHRDRAPAQR